MLNYLPGRQIILSVVVLILLVAVLVMCWLAFVVDLLTLEVDDEEDSCTYDDSDPDGSVLANDDT